MHCFKHMQTFAQGGCPDCKAEYEASREALDHCPTCESPQPRLHPAMQHEGEVELCHDSWHKPKP